MNQTKHKQERDTLSARCTTFALPLVYVGMSADIIHHGHVNILKEASKHGNVMVGLLTDEAIRSYKRAPIIPYVNRKVVIEYLQNIYTVVPQNTLDYSENLLKYQPDYVVHGSDWKTGVQKRTRDKVLSVIQAWGGELIEPEYTKNISTTHIIQRCINKSDSCSSLI